MVYRTAPFAMILNNLWPIFQGHAILGGPVNNNCDNPLCTYGDASVNLCSSQPATCTTTTKIKQNSVRSVKSEAQHYLRSTYCSEANDRHEASRGLFATAELLVAYPCMAYYQVVWIDCRKTTISVQNRYFSILLPSNIITIFFYSRHRSLQGHTMW